jgi:hypothetical protein
MNHPVMTMAKKDKVWKITRPAMDPVHEMMSSTP